MKVLPLIRAQLYRVEVRYEPSLDWVNRDFVEYRVLHPESGEELFEITRSLEILDDIPSVGGDLNRMDEWSAAYDRLAEEARQRMHLILSYGDAVLRFLFDKRGRVTSLKVETRKSEMPSYSATLTHVVHLAQSREEVRFNIHTWDINNFGEGCIEHDGFVNRQLREQIEEIGSMLWRFVMSADHALSGTETGEFVMCHLKHSLEKDTVFAVRPSANNGDGSAQ